MSRVALVFGGRSVEHKVSIRSARTVSAALREDGHEVVPFGIALNGAWLEPAAAVPALKGDTDVLEAPEGPVPPTLGPFLESGVDVAFPIVHGTWGEDGTLQGLFEMIDLPYVGAGVAASAVAMDKVLSKELFRQAGLPVTDYVFVRHSELEGSHAEVGERLGRIPPPLFVKPSVGGSSVGIRRVERRDEVCDAVKFALRFDDTALVEREVDGRELECSVLGYPRLRASSVGEIVPGNEFYDYADKYLEDRAELHVPADLDEEVESRVRELAVGAFTAIGGYGMARVDFLLEAGSGELFVNEINTLPGFTDISMYPKLWGASGLSLNGLVGLLVEEALARHRDRHRLDQGIKAWVAELEEREKKG